MLVLSRKAGEQIIIGNNICVTVVGIRGNQIRIGINAPTEISIVREELFEPFAIPLDRTGHELKETNPATENP